MKHLFLSCCIILGTLVAGIIYAETPYMNKNMQGMMQQMQGMQECMMKIDQDALMALGERAKQVEQELESLCQQGKSEQARSKALDFVQTLKNNPEVTQAQACLKDLPDMMQGHVPFSDITDMEEDYQHEDICSAKKAFKKQ